MEMAVSILVSVAAALAMLWRHGREREAARKMPQLAPVEVSRPRRRRLPR